MRQAIMVTLLGSILVLTMQCSNKESLNSLGGSTELATAAIADTYYFVTIDGFLDSLIVHTDSIRWVYEFPTEGPSSQSIIISGLSQADLQVETYTDSVKGIVSLARDSMGAFSDTILLAISHRSGVVLPPQNSRLFVKNTLHVFDIDTLWMLDTLQSPDSIQVFDTVQVRDSIQVLDTIPLVNPW